MTDRVLVTCPPMLGLIDEFAEAFANHGLEFTAADVVQTMTEDELIALLPDYDGWIIGDDPASRRVMEEATKGRLRACVKWGVGTDNVDFDAFGALGVPVENTPGVFGNEVADVALTYTLGLARETYAIDRQIRTMNAWPKPSGISVLGRKIGIVGFGDIGQQTARRLIACGAEIVAYDPAYKHITDVPAEHAVWPERLDEVDFLIFTCPLNAATHHMFNHGTLELLKSGVRIVNVGRGGLIEEAALIEGITTGRVHSAALDVFEVEPLDPNSPLRRFDQCIFGSHNGSNSVDAVRRVSHIAVDKIARLLKESIS
ncbi:MAG: phosphoglycerate dehydrogenase [Hyphomonadaceae bacterium]